MLDTVKNHKKYEIKGDGLVIVDVGCTSFVKRIIEIKTHHTLSNSPRENPARGDSL